MDGFKYSSDSLNLCTHPEVIQESPYVFKRIQIPHDSGLQKKAEASTILFLIQGRLQISAEKKEKKSCGRRNFFSGRKVFLMSCWQRAPLKYLFSVFPIWLFYIVNT